MKPNIKYVISLAAIAFAVSLANFCTATVVVPSRGIPARTLQVVPPVTAVPNSYVWDGRYYVGVVGNQYYYLGPGNVWTIMDTPANLSYFRAWEQAHPNWQAHTTPNVLYRGRGNRVQQLSPAPVAPPNQIRSRGRVQPLNPPPVTPTHVHVW